MQVLESLVVVFNCESAIVRNVGTGLPEEESNEGSSDTGSGKLHVRGLGKTDNVEEVSSGEKFVLVAPRSHYANSFFVTTDR